MRHQSTTGSRFHKAEGPGSPQDPDVGKEVLITNVSTFNGISGTLITGKDLVLKGNTIAKIIHR